jgi:hypothetical protein
MKAYTTRPYYRFIKLHGSVDWGMEFQEIPGSGSPTDVINSSSQGIAVWGGAIEKIDINMRVPDTSFRFPAIAIPVQKKDEFVCPQTHVKSLADAIPSVTKIITVGWRASEDKFLGMLKSPLTGLKKDVDLMVVSGSAAGAKETVNNLGMNIATERKRCLLEGGFTGLINQIGLLDHFLRD